MKKNSVSLAKANRTLTREWHPAKNPSLTPKNASPHSLKRAWWMCDKGHEWEASIKIRHQTGSGCPFCKGRRANKENCLQTVNRQLASEWHPTKNKALTPNEVTAGARRKVWWRCSKGHEWKAAVYSRTEGHGCPYCSGRQVCKDNCLQTVNPNLAREWHPTRNKPLTPRKVTLHSNKTVWWVCRKGHEWKTVINSRSTGVGCPYCGGHRATEDRSLQTVSPRLAREWHATRNGSWLPKDVSPFSKRQAWWKCGKGHEARERVVDRHRRGGCAECSLRTRVPRLFL